MRITPVKGFTGAYSRRLPHTKTLSKAQRFVLTSIKL